MDSYAHKQIIPVSVAIKGYRYIFPQWWIEQAVREKLTREPDFQSLGEGATWTSEGANWTYEWEQNEDDRVQVTLEYLKKIYGPEDQDDVQG